MNGKIIFKAIIKKDYVRSDGTSAIYLLVRVNNKRKKIPLNIAVAPAKFNEKTQKVRGNSKLSKDYNILIEKAKAKISEIELNYRLANKNLTLEELLKEYETPTPNYDFLAFFEYELNHQEKYLQKGTFKQQKSSLKKLKKWKGIIPFSAINSELLKELKLYCKNVLKNEQTTVSTLLKNFKKFLHLANDKGIITDIKYTDIKVPRSKSQRTFLIADEVSRIYEYWNSPYISDTHKKVLSKFLFSAFTSLRISDIQKITTDNIINNQLVYAASKTGKLNKINLNNTAKLMIQETEPLFLDNYTPEYINRELKVISSFLKIKKKVTFHVARHTFATNFIDQGGNVVNLQQIMDHSNIRETMIYVHLVNHTLNEQINLLDNIIKSSQTSE
jgi:site-specific recombinase XerD